MKQYNKIWVSDENSDWEVTGEDYSGEVSKGRVSPIYKVVVCSIEELKEAFEVFSNYGAYGNDPRRGGMDFEEFVKEKGITI